MKKETNYEALKKLAGAFKEEKEYWEEVKNQLYKNRNKSSF